MQIDHHIRSCPVIRESAGEEPYPQPSVVFATTPSGTVSVDIYDFSVEPPVRLTTTALSGVELTAPTLTGLADNYTLDMGHANVTALVDCYAREGLELVVMFADSGTAASRYVKVTCNDADHIALLYPEQAIYAVANSGNTGTAFPVGSLYLPAEDLGDACAILTARGSMILDCAGSWNGGGTGSGGCRSGDISTHLSAVGALVRTRTTASWYPHVSGEVIDLVDCTVLSVNVPFGFALGNFSNGTYFAGSPSMVNCRVQTSYFTGNGSTRAGSPNLNGCKLDGNVYLTSFQSPGCWSFDAINCVNGTDIVVDFSSMGGSTGSWVDCTGAFQVDNMASGKTIEMIGIKGVPDITLDSSSNSNLTVSLSGAYNQLVNNTGGPLAALTERKLATEMALTNNIINLAPDSVTVTEAPNLDAAITTCATQAQITGLNNLSQIQAQAGAAAAITAAEPVAANVTEVAGSAVAGVAAFQASGFAVPGDAMTLASGAIAAATFAADALSAAALSTSAAQKIRDEIDASTSFVGRTLRQIKARFAIDGIHDGGSGVADLAYDADGHHVSTRGRAWDTAGAVPATTGGSGSESATAEITIVGPKDSAHPSLPRNVRGVTS